MTTAVSRRRSLGALLAIAAAAAAPLVVLFTPLRPLAAALVPEPIKATVVWPLMDLVQNFVFTIGFTLALSVTLVAERLWPADRAQRQFGEAFGQDFVWLFYERVLNTIVISTYVYWLSAGFERYTPWLRIDAVAAWPSAVRVLIGFLLLDFLYWFQHFLNHRVPLLWQFHAVHHSQQDLNFFTDFRYHIVEYLIRHTILVVPFLILGIAVPTIVLLSVVLMWYTRFYHGNIRTGLGPMRYLVVTPQSHRVHHSRLPEHFDTNFGAILSVWDRLFRTASPDIASYPPTGIPDAEFPVQRNVPPWKQLYAPLVQMAYPFRRLAMRAQTRVRGTRMAPSD